MVKWCVVCLQHFTSRFPPQPCPWHHSFDKRLGNFRVFWRSRYDYLLLEQWSKFDALFWVVSEPFPPISHNFIFCGLFLYWFKHLGDHFVGKRLHCPIHWWIKNLVRWPKNRALVACHMHRLVYATIFLVWLFTLKADLRGKIQLSFQISLIY